MYKHNPGEVYKATTAFLQDIELPTKVKVLYPGTLAKTGNPLPIIDTPYLVLYCSHWHRVYLNRFNQVGLPHTFIYDSSKSPLAIRLQVNKAF